MFSIPIIAVVVGMVILAFMAWIMKIGRGANDWFAKIGQSVVGFLVIGGGIVLLFIFLAAGDNKGISNVSFDGTITPTFNPSAKEIVVEVNSINNRGTGKSGNLTLSLWACDAQHAGSTIEGVKLADGDLNDDLKSGYHFDPTSHKFTVKQFPPFGQPKTIVLALNEKHSTDSEYSIADYRNFEQPYTFNRKEWLKWWERTTTWGWVGIVSGGITATGLLGTLIYRFTRSNAKPGNV